MKINDRVLTCIMMGAVFIATYGGGVAYAATDTGVYDQSTTNASTAVTYQLDEASTYTFNIPATISLSSSQSVQETISVTDCNLTDASMLQVSICEGLNSSGQVPLSYVNEEGANNPVEEVIYSTVTDENGNTLNIDDPILTIKQGVESGSATINYSSPVSQDNDSNITPGQYEGFVQFSISTDVLPEL